MMQKHANYQHSRVALATDHAGYTLKEILKKHMVENGIDVVDVGTFSEESIDYPIIAKKIAEVMLGEKIPGVFLGGSGLCVRPVVGIFETLR